jgi:hypothetical protein
LEACVLKLLRTAGTIACAGALVITGTATGAAAAPARASCAGTVRIVSFGFTPGSVTAGQSATAQLVARSCTGQAQQDSVQWSGHFSGPQPGIPAGCPAVDPILLPAAIPATGRYTAGIGYLVFASCTATDLQVSVSLRAADGSVLATRTADLTITPAG